MADYQYKINAQNIEDPPLSVVPPRSEHSEYATTYATGDGGEVGDGFPQCVWNFDFLTTAMMNTLLSKITGQSTVVSLQTRLNTGAYQLYATAVMHRPKVPSEAVRVFGGWRNVKFRFTRLEI